jgi:hypothetical protein
MARSTRDRPRNAEMEDMRLSRNLEAACIA